MPLGSSSEAPVIKPGPRTSRSLGPSDGVIAADDCKTSLFTAIPLQAGNLNSCAAALFQANSGNTGGLLPSKILREAARSRKLRSRAKRSRSRAGEVLQSQSPRIKSGDGETGFWRYGHWSQKPWCRL